MTSAAKRAYDRAWRQRNRARTRAYDAARPPRRRLTPRASRADYFRDYRARKAAERPVVLRVKVRKPTRAAIAAHRAARAAEVEAKLRAAIQAELEAARAVPELEALIREQARDAQRFQIKYGPDFEDRSPVEWVA